MMYTTLALLAFIATAQAVGRAIVTNQCDTPVYLYSVSSTTGPEVELLKDQSYSESYQSTAFLKIFAAQDAISVPNASQILFGYALSGNNVSYNLSDSNGAIFAGLALSIKAAEGCEDLYWSSPKSNNTQQTCGSDTDLELSFCTGHCLPPWCKYRSFIHMLT